MQTEFWLFGQFNKALLTIGDVQTLIGLKPKSLRNMISSGTFPRPLPGGSFAIQDIAAWIDSHRTPDQS